MSVFQTVEISSSASPPLSPIGEPAVENTGLSVGLSLGVLLIAAVLIATVVIIVMCVQILRKKETIHMKFLMMHMKFLMMHMKFLMMHMKSCMDIPNGFPRVQTSTNIKLSDSDNCSHTQTPSPLMFCGIVTWNSSHSSSSNSDSDNYIVYSDLKKKRNGSYRYI